MSGKNKTNKQTKTKEEQAFVSEWHPPFNIHRKKNPVKNLFRFKLLLRTSMMHYYCRDTTCGRDTDPF